MESRAELKEAKMKLKQKFAKLIDDDVARFEIKHEALLRRLQAASGKTKEEIIKMIFEK